MSVRLSLSAKLWAEEASQAAPVKVWVTPQGYRMIRVPQLPPPRYFAERHTADGDKEVFDWACHVKCSQALPCQLGLDIDHQTLLRLIKADLVGAAQVTPRNFLVDLTSLHQFLQEARDPLFWTPNRKERYRQSRAHGEYV